MLRNFAGAEDKFIFGWAVVEEDDDPLFLGRVKARVFGFDAENKEDQPTEKLRWAYPILPIDSHRSVTGVKRGDYVMIFYSDSLTRQRIYYLGILPGIPEIPADPSRGFFDPTPDSELNNDDLPRPDDQCTTKYRIPTPTEVSGDPCGPIPDVEDEVAEFESVTRLPLENRLTESTCSRLERNEKIDETIVEFKRHDLGKAKKAAHKNSGVGSDEEAKADIWEEPVTPYNTKYPFNQVKETRAGHYFELDDTPADNQRIHLYHRAGTFFEWHPNGTQVKKIRRENYEFVIHSHHFCTYKDANLTSGLDFRIQAGKRINIHAKEDLNFDTEKNRNTIIREDSNTRVQKNDNKVVDEKEKTKIKKEQSLIVEKNVEEHFKVNHNTTIDSNRNLTILKALLASIGDSATVEIKDDGTFVIGGDLKIAIKGDLKIGVDGDIAIDSSKTLSLSAKEIKTQAAVATEITSGVLTSIVGEATGPDFHAKDALTAQALGSVVQPPAVEVETITAPHTYSVSVPKANPEDPETADAQAPCP